MAHIIQTAVRPSEACPEVSPLLDAPLLRMLAKDPNERPSSAGEAILALRRAAAEAGVRLLEEPLRLPRPAPTVSGEQLRGEPDTLLDSGPATEQDARMATTARDGARPLWPFGVGLLGMGALLGFVVLRGPASAPAADVHPAASSPPVASPLAATVVPPPVVSAAASNQPVAASAPAPSGSALPVRSGDSKKAKPRASAGARIPTDLENPF
jgi:hypothetical protein